MVAKNHQKEDGIWLIYYKKHTQKPSVAYNDAVEEALCFGWIDGKVKTIDDEQYMQRYTPRRPKSNWSVSNIERVKKMINEGKMTEWGLQAYEEGMKTSNIIPSSKDFSIPQDFKDILESNPKAATFLYSLPPSAQLAFVYWVDTAKTETTRQRRIKESIKLLEQKKRLM